MPRGLSVFFTAFFCLCAVVGYAANTSNTGVIRASKQPRVRIYSVKSGQEIDTRLIAMPSATVGQKVTIKYGVDPEAVPTKWQYRYRLQTPENKSDLGWSNPTEDTEFRWTPERAGIYRFEVQAVDSSLNYTASAGTRIKVIDPPFSILSALIIGAIVTAFFMLIGPYRNMRRRRKIEAFEPISNPYIVEEPIRSKDMFFGRKSDLEFIRMRLGTEESGMVIVFTGERKIGKTSILLQILNGELGERLVPVLMDMQSIIIVDETEFIRKLVSEISGALGKAGLEAPNAVFQEQDAYHKFEGFISAVMEILGGKGLLLMFDEYELIEAKIDSGILRPEIITLFADMLDKHPRLSLIFTGSKSLEEQKSSYWDRLAEKSLHRSVGPLSEKSALLLITEPASDQVIYPTDIPEYILSLTDGHPHYTQMVCQKLIDRLNEMKRNRLRQEDVDAVKLNH